MPAAHSERTATSLRRDHCRSVDMRLRSSTRAGGEKHQGNGDNRRNEQLRKPVHASIRLGMRKLAPDRSLSLLT